MIDIYALNSYLFYKENAKIEICYKIDINNQL